MKKIISIITCVTFIVLMCSSSFAVGERFTFSSTFSNYFVSTGSVPQKSDRKLNITNNQTYLTRGSDLLSGHVTYRAVSSRSGSPTVGYSVRLVGNGQSANIDLMTSSSVRRVYVKVSNPSPNTTKYTKGTAVLYAY